MFTGVEREHIRESLIAAAHADERITAGAVVGSAAVDGEDAWSDIDLAWRVDLTEVMDQVVADWTDRMVREHGAVTHTDLRLGPVGYRVFLLDNGLQVNLAFCPDAEFGPRAETFRLLFGAAGTPRTFGTPDPAELVGMGWWHALHARTALERGRWWQAEHLLDGLRDRIFGLACLRHGVSTRHGRGRDLLPASFLELMTDTRPGELSEPDLRRALAAAVAALLSEVELVDAELAARLRPALDVTPG